MTPQIKTLGDLMEVAPMFGRAAVSWVQLGIDSAPLREDEPIDVDDALLMEILLSLSEAESSLVQGDKDEYISPNE